MSKNREHLLGQLGNKDIAPQNHFSHQVLSVIIQTYDLLQPLKSILAELLASPFNPYKAEQNISLMLISLHQGITRWSLTVHFPHQTTQLFNFDSLVLTLHLKVLLLPIGRCQLDCQFIHLPCLVAFDHRRYLGCSRGLC